MQLAIDIPAWPPNLHTCKFAYMLFMGYTVCMGLHTWKLNGEQRDEIVRLRAKGMSVIKLAERFGIKVASVYGLLNRRRDAESTSVIVPTPTPPEKKPARRILPPPPPHTPHTPPLPPSPPVDEASFFSALFPGVTKST